MAKKRFKRFSSVLDDVIFELHGEEFVCFPELDYRKYRKMIEDLGSNDEADAVDNLIQSIASMIPDAKDRERFNNLINDDSHITSLRLLSEIWQYLLIEYKVLNEDPEDPKS